LEEAHKRYRSTYEEFVKAQQKYGVFAKETMAALQAYLFAKHDFDYHSSEEHRNR
jgi:hypothetical protein